MGRWHHNIQEKPVVEDFRSSGNDLLPKAYHLELVLRDLLDSTSAKNYWKLKDKQDNLERRTNKNVKEKHGHFDQNLQKEVAETVGELATEN